MSINPNAPVVTNGEIEIAASIDKVWEIMSAVEQWPHWHPKVRWAELRGQLYPGTRMFWRYGSRTITSVIKEVDFQRYMSWKSTTGGVICNHASILETIDGGTRVRVEKSLEGLVPWLFPEATRKRLEREIQAGLKYLKTAAERR